jgi:hypothetical protein
MRKSTTAACISKRLLTGWEYHTSCPSRCMIHGTLCVTKACNMPNPPFQCMIHGTLCVINACNMPNPPSIPYSDLVAQDLADIPRLLTKIHESFVDPCAMNNETAE